MTLFLWCMIGLGLAALIAVSVPMCLSGRPLAALGKSAASGFLALAAVNVVGGFTGVSLGLGWLSAGVCTFLGLPGVAMLLFLKTVFLL